tara:strand:- start:1580 stop:2074 length:495 start_codon:yes stop_codon:yes gene_type:complete
MSNTPLTRAQIYAIRDRAARGESAPRIKVELSLPVSLETVRRVIRRDTHAEIGVGSLERAFVSNRLAGESRATGDYAPAYHRPVDAEMEAQVAQAREVARAMREAMRAEVASGPPPDPFDLPEPTGPSAEELLAAHAQPPEAQAPLAAFESADELLAQITAQRA